MGAQSKIRVMIASDHPIMQDGLRLRIQLAQDMVVVCEARDLAEIQRAFEICRPDIVVLDLYRPRNAAARVMRSIRHLSPMTPVVVLTDDRAEVVELPRAGDQRTVSVSRISANDEIIPAIRKAMTSGGTPRAAGQS